MDTVGGLPISSSGESVRRATGLKGREAELGAIADFLGRGMSAGGAVMVQGAAGVGKSALVGEALAAVVGRARVLRARGAESEASTTLATFHQLMLPAADSLAALVEPHGSVLRRALGLEPGATPTPIELTSSVVAWLRRLSADTPLVLALDDAHLADPASAHLLSVVARRLAGVPVAIVLVQRTDSGGTIAAGGMEELDVEPLRAVHADALLRDSPRRLHRAVRRRLVEEANGNPLALQELVRGLTSEQRAGHVLLPEVIPLTPRLRGVLAGRIDALAVGARELLLRIALNRDGGVPVASLLEGFRDDLDVVEALGLVRLHAVLQRLRFEDPLIGSLVAELASPAERRAAHSALAQLCVDRHQRAWHLAEATIGVDDEVARDLAASAFDAFERGEVLRAVATMERAGELSAHGQDRVIRFGHAAFWGSHVLGSVSGPHESLARASVLEPSGSTSLATATAHASQVVNAEGGAERAFRLLQRALGEAHEADTAGLEAAMTTLLFVCVIGGRYEYWVGYRDLVAKYEAQLPKALALSAITFGNPTSATPSMLADLDALLQIADQDLNPVSILQSALAGFPLDRVPRRALERVVEDGRRGGAVVTGIVCMSLLAADAVTDGRWDDALRLADECVELCAEHGLTALRWGGLHPMMFIAACRGDRARLAAAASDARGLPPGTARALPSVDANVEAQLALAEGRFDDAFRAYQGIVAPGEFPPFEPVAMWTILDVVEAGLCSGRPAEARRHLRAAEEAGLPELSSRIRFVCAAASAYLASDDRYIEAFDAVLAAPDAERWPFILARVELTYGDRLRRSREIRQARSHLQRAAELFAALDAGPWHERAVASLRATGQHRRRSDPFASPTLTPKEEEIARLAARGLSNKQIGQRLYLSARTVSGHLYRVFPKLGITSRAALRDALTAEDIAS